MNQDYIDKWDLFGASVPHFNFDGKRSIGTGVGLTCSILLALVIGSFTGLKCLHLAIGHNPNVMVSEEEDSFTSNETAIDLM